MSTVPHKTYALVATLGDWTETKAVIGQATYSSMKVAGGDETAAIEFDATMDAISKVLDAAVRSKLWAKGQIQLIDPATDEVLHTMDAKEEVTA